MVQTKQKPSPPRQASWALLVLFATVGCIEAEPKKEDKPCADKKCGQNASCDKSSDSCVCHTGYRGQDCQQCDEGYYLQGGLCGAGRVIADFEDLTLATESFWNGSDNSSGFQSGAVWFSNYYDGPTSSWDGFAYSNTTDTSSTDFGNQYSAFAGSGEGQSANYAVAYHFLYAANPPTLSLADTTQGYRIAGAYFCNTTLAYKSMSDGDGYAKKFGGASGDDPDWFLLTLQGVDQNGEEAGKVEFYLADYRFEDNSQDYIVEDWTWVDLTGLGEVVAVEMELTSSDSGPAGINTPAYFAVDKMVAAAQ